MLAPSMDSGTLSALLQKISEKASYWQEDLQDLHHIITYGSTKHLPPQEESFANLEAAVTDLEEQLLEMSKELSRRQVDRVRRASDARSFCGEASSPRLTSQTDHHMTPHYIAPTSNR